MWSGSPRLSSFWPLVTSPYASRTKALWFLRISGEMHGPSEEKGKLRLCVFAEEHQQHCQSRPGKWRCGTLGCSDGPFHSLMSGNPPTRWFPAENSRAPGPQTNRRTQAVSFEAPALDHRENKPLAIRDPASPGAPIRVNTSFVNSSGVFCRCKERSAFRHCNNGQAAPSDFFFGRQKRKHLMDEEP